MFASPGSVPNGGCTALKYKVPYGDCATCETSVLPIAVGPNTAASSHRFVRWARWYTRSNSTAGTTSSSGKPIGTKCVIG